MNRGRSIVATDLFQTMLQQFLAKQQAESEDDSGSLGGMLASAIPMVLALGGGGDAAALAQAGAGPGTLKNPSITPEITPPGLDAAMNVGTAGVDKLAPGAITTPPPVGLGTGQPQSVLGQKLIQNPNLWRMFLGQRG
jgi:hypothetical protein